MKDAASFLDEDGFKPRVPLTNISKNLQNNEGYKNNPKKNVTNYEKIARNQVFSKDVKFLLKVKRLRKKKGQQDVRVC